jgi:hypothetical protein
MRSLIAGLALAAASLTIGTAAQAAPLTSQGISVPSVSMDVQYRRPAPRCFRWRAYCSSRYPGGGWRFRRCLAIHGCVR